MVLVKREHVCLVQLQDLLDRQKADVVESFDALRLRAAEDKVKVSTYIEMAYFFIRVRHRSADLPRSCWWVNIFLL